MLALSLSFAAQITDLPGLSDSDFLQAIEWDRSADQELQEAAAAGNVAAFCKAWQSCRRIADGNAKSGASKPGTACSERVLWSQHGFPEEVGLARVLIQSVDGPIKASGVTTRRPVNKPAVTWSQRVQPLVSDLTVAVRSLESRPFALLAALDFIDQSGHLLSAGQFFPLWRHTLSELLMWPTAIHPDPTVPDDVLVIEHGEIPFVGGLVFRDISNSANLVKTGRKLLGRQLVDQTDGDGTPHAAIISRLPLWLAPFVRATIAGERHKVAVWNDEQRLLLTNVVDRAILLCRPDGRAALTNGLRLDSLPVLLAAAELFGLGLVGSTGDYLRAVQRSVEGKPPKKNRPEIATMPSSQSDWARFALLRSDLSVEADSVAMTHHLPLPQLDVTALGHSLIHGDWNLKLKLGDAAVELAEEWSCVCWQSDPDADYIELQMAGPGKLRVERLVLLSRKERFLIVADSISGVPLADAAARTRSAGSSSATGTKKSSEPVPQRIEYESRLTLCDGMVGSCDGTTREGRITGHRIRSRVFPLAIPQDRVHSTPHQFSVEGNELVLKHVAEGSGLFAPLVFVWHPERSRVEATWRPLTVTEDGKAVGPDCAAGYRLKLGKLQLLISRSLKKTGLSRACLGYHSFNETVIASFDSNGDVTPILLVE